VTLIVAVTTDTTVVAMPTQSALVRSDAKFCNFFSFTSLTGCKRHRGGGRGRRPTERRRRPKLSFRGLHRRCIRLRDGRKEPQVILVVATVRSYVLLHGDHIHLDVLGLIFRFLAHLRFDLAEETSDGAKKNRKNIPEEHRRTKSRERDGE
jgi:hypothetical protein